MTRYRQQLRRALAERAAEVRKELADRERRTLRAGEPIPADALPGEVFDLVADVDGTELPMARLRYVGGPPSCSLQIIAARPATADPYLIKRTPDVR